MNISKKLLTLVFGVSMLASVSNSYSMTVDTLYGITSGAGIAALSFWPIRSFFLNEKPLTSNEKAFIGMGAVLGMGALAFRCLNGISLRNAIGSSPTASFFAFIAVGGAAILNATR